MGVFLSKQVLKLLENVAPGNLIAVDWCDALLASFERIDFAGLFGLVPLVGWML